MDVDIERVKKCMELALREAAKGDIDVPFSRERMVQKLVAALKECPLPSWAAEVRIEVERDADDPVAFRVRFAQG